MCPRFTIDLGTGNCGLRIMQNSMPTTDTMNTMKGSMLAILLSRVGGYVLCDGTPGVMSLIATLLQMAVFARSVRLLYLTRTFAQLRCQPRGPENRDYVGLT